MPNFFIAKRDKLLRQAPIYEFTITHMHASSGKEKKSERHQISRDVSSLIGKEELRIYSCRVRREGPDYRTFVSNNQNRWKCYHKRCSSAQVIRSRSLASADCQHITSLKLEYATMKSDRVYGPLKLDQSKLEVLTIPERYKREIDEMLKKSTPLIQRVSSETFVVRSIEESQEHPLGLLHLRLQKKSVYRKDLKQQIQQIPSLYCSCSAYQNYQQHNTSTVKLSRRCVHFYICMWAIISDADLCKEFPAFNSGGQLGIYGIAYNFNYRY